ncbi:MAG TPA: NAD-dependent epimerase/dehydratase family protein [Candidatus Obscuribacterales bacterium]
MPQQILITGGTGFIGSHLARKLLSLGYSVAVLGRRPADSSLIDLHGGDPALDVLIGDLSDGRLLDRALGDAETIFHKASSYRDATGSPIEDVLHSNIRGTQALIAALRRGKHRVRRILFDSSISVYGEGNYLCDRCGIVRPSVRSARVVLETQCFDPPCPNCSGRIQPQATPETAALNGASAYARSKKTQETLMQSAAREVGFDLVIFRYATVYGPGQTSSSPYARFIDVLRTGGTVIVNEDGRQRRDFVYVDDVVRANVIALERDTTGVHIYNVGTGMDTPLIEFVSYARDFAPRQSGTPPGGIEVTGRMVAGDVRHCKIDCSLLEKELGFKAEVSWKTGVHLWLASLPATTASAP